MAIFKAEIKIKLKKGVADPEGANTKKALELLGFSGIRELNSIKLFEVTIDSESENAAKAEIEEMCRRLLANPVIHNYSISFRKPEG